VAAAEAAVAKAGDAVTDMAYFAPQAPASASARMNSEPLADEFLVLLEPKLARRMDRDLLDTVRAFAGPADALGADSTSRSEKGTRTGPCQL
jgi:hypothetical protein